MDSSNSNLHVTVFDLERSPHLEDRELVQKCEELLMGVLETLRPILRYLCSPLYLNFSYLDYRKEACSRSFSVRCVNIGNYSNQKENWIYLTENGKFFTVKTYTNKVSCCGDKSPQQHLEDGDDTWKCMLFDELLQKLREMLVKAEEKRKKHLESVASRRALLDQMLAVLSQQKSKL